MMLNTITLAAEFCHSLYIPKNGEVEVILIFRKKPTTFNQKVSELREAIRDTLFLNDLRDISEDFKSVDLEGWEENNAI